MSNHYTPRPFAERPRPVRCYEHPVAKHMRTWLETPVRQGLADRCTLGDMMMGLLASPQYQRSIGGTIDFEGGPHGVLFLLAEAAYQLHPDSTVFEVERSLTHRLNTTEFSAEHPIPAEYCRLPVDAPIYLHVPGAPDELAVVTDQDTLPLCGYYLRETHAGGRRVLEIAAVSQPGKGDTSCEQDNFLFIDLPISDENESLLTLFQRANRLACENLGVIERPELRARVLPHLEFVMKVLVYLNLSEARRVPHRDRSNAFADAGAFWTTQARCRASACDQALRLRPHLRHSGGVARRHRPRHGGGSSGPLPQRPLQARALR